MAHMSVEALEKHVRAFDHDQDELTLVLAELGYRKTKRALELHELVSRLRRAATGNNQD